jgi:hypothetical protein
MGCLRLPTGILMASPALPATSNPLKEYVFVNHLLAVNTARRTPWLPAPPSLKGAGGLGSGSGTNQNDRIVVIYRRTGGNGNSK